MTTMLHLSHHNNVAPLTTTTMLHLSHDTHNNARHTQQCRTFLPECQWLKMSILDTLPPTLAPNQSHSRGCLLRSEGCVVINTMRWCRQCNQAGPRLVKIGVQGLLSYHTRFSTHIQQRPPLFRDHGCTSQTLACRELWRCLPALWVCSVAAT